VVVQHPNELSTEDIKHAVREAGFEIVQTPADNSLNLDQPSDLISTQERHIEQRKDQEHQNSYEINGQLLVPPNEGGVTDLDLQKPADSLLITNHESNSFLGGFRVTLAVGGMTCAACSTTVTRMISELSGVSDVTVDLLGMSATLIVDHEEFAETVAEVVEDGGYEAQIVSVEPVHSTVIHQETQATRTISLRVDGMFSPYVTQ
jgi:Cu+-exporting ATPase